MSKRIIKKTLSMLCVVSMLASLVGLCFPKKAEATEAEILDSTLTSISFSDFSGFGDGTHYIDVTSNKNGTYGGDLYGKVIEGYVEFGNSSYINLYDGTSTTDYHGRIQLKSDKTGNIAVNTQIKGVDTAVVKLFTITEGYAATSSNPEATELYLQLSVQLVDNDNGGTADDLKLGVWINGKLYKNTYYYRNNWKSEGATSYTKSYMVVNCDYAYYNQDKTQTYPENYIKIDSLKRLNSGFKSISFSDFGIADGTYSKSVGWATGKNRTGRLNETVIEGYMKFGFASQITVTRSGLNTRVRLKSNTNGTINLQIRDYNNATVEYNTSEIYAPKTADVADAEKYATAWGNAPEIYIQLSFQLLAEDADGIKNDLKLGLWINGLLYQNQYYTYKNWFANEEIASTTYTMAMGGDNNTYSRIKTTSIILGDNNQDDSLDVIDLARLIKRENSVELNTNLNEILADMNRNHVVDKNDTTMTREALLEN